MSASYDKTGSQKIQEMMEQLPPPPSHWAGRPIHTHFNVLDPSGGKVIFTQWLGESYYDKPSPGIAVFNEGFRSGIVSPGGEVIGVGTGRDNRLIVMDYHGGYYISVFTFDAQRSPQYDQLRMVKRISQVEDEHLREKLMIAMLDPSWIPRSIMEFALAVHSYHREMGDARHDEPSVIYA